jgi:RNAse (barnase) inhibitor barstar
MGKLALRLSDASRSGVYRVARPDEVVEAAREAGLRLDTVAFGAKTVLLKGIAAALAFPHWFGENWDALEDCLTDLSWSGAPGHVLLFEGARAGDDFGVLVDILQSAAEYWVGRGKPFFAVFIDPKAALPLPELFRRA